VRPPCLPRPAPGASLDVVRREAEHIPDSVDAADRPPCPSGIMRLLECTDGGGEAHHSPRLRIALPSAVVGPVAAYASTSRLTASSTTVDGLIVQRLAEAIGFVDGLGDGCEAWAPASAARHGMSLSAKVSASRSVSSAQRW